MSKAQTSHLETGCYYAPNSYASVGERLIAIVIDSVVFVLLFGIVAFIVYSVPRPAASDPSAELSRETMILAFTLISTIWLYFIELARSRFGTIGLRVMKLRIVNLKGEKPDWFQMLSRLLNGPFNELLRVPFERDKKTISDKSCGLYVIKRDATPAGSGPIVLDYCSMLGSMHGYISEVKH